jgi:hypothetical protein
MEFNQYITVLGTQIACDNIHFHITVCNQQNIFYTKCSIFVLKTTRIYFQIVCHFIPIRVQCFAFLFMLKS